MPRQGVTIYELLLSCPGDVLDLIDTVKECVEDFNRLYGNLNNIKIEVKHWSTDSYPQSGGQSQELLNDQFIHKCDACVALFGNRFGTPTDRYESGTEEEIEDMIGSGKQVFMYFIERQIDPSQIDIEQLAKVRNFKKKYSEESKGIYWPVKSKEEFKKLFSNHLGLYFLQLVSEPINLGQAQQLPKLEFLTSGGETEAKIIRSNFHECTMIRNKELSILEKINKIKNIIIEDNSLDIYESSGQSSDEEIAASLSPKWSEQMAGLTKINNTLAKIPGFSSPDYRKAEISNSIKSDINNYCDSKNIEIPDIFWNLGGLQKEFRAIIYAGSGDEKFIGTNEQQEKYNLIDNLWCDILEYNQYYKFFAEIDDFYALNCIVRNMGTTYDEDIDIKIKIPNGCIVKCDELPIPGYSCIEEINKSDICDILLSGRKTADIDTYSGYQINHYTDYDALMNFSPFGHATSTEIYNREKKKYQKKISKFFCYEYFKNEEFDILVFNIKYLKQKTSMYLPSILFFKKEPDFIEFEISSKFYPDILSGRILIDKLK